MDKIKIGLPRGLFFYYDGNILKSFFENLNFQVIVSPKTNRFILEQGMKYANDEMCLSLKLLIGHVSYLQDKCDYLLIPRIDNYGINDQTCTNFLALYDIIKNLFDKNIITYNINLNKKETLLKGLWQIAKAFNIKNKDIITAYKKAINCDKEIKNSLINNNYSKLYSSKLKILLVGHSYNIHDDYIGIPVVKYLNKLNCEVLYSDYFNSNTANKLSSYFSKSLYWKYSKESIGSIKLIENNIDGIIFLTTFPCGLDSLVNELVIRKLKIPNINLILDDINSLAGIYTRLESFIDILEQRREYA